MTAMGATKAQRYIAAVDAELLTARAFSAKLDTLLMFPEWDPLQPSSLLPEDLELLLPLLPLPDLLLFLLDLALVEPQPFNVGGSVVGQPPPRHGVGEEVLSEGNSPIDVGFKDLVGLSVGVRVLCYELSTK